MPDLRTSIAKEISNIPHPKISFPIPLSFKSPAIEDKTQEIGILKDVKIQSEEARIPQPLYDVASNAIPLKSYISEVDINPSSRMSLFDVNVVFSPLRVDVFDPHLISKIEIFSLSLKILGLNKLSIYGMNYDDKYWHKIDIPSEGNISQTRIKKSREQTEEFPTEIDKRKRKSKFKQPMPSVWDLLFAVLQPPLNFGQFENLFLSKRPFDYQWLGIKFLTDNEHALLADDMGTGKTVMTAVALKILIQQAKVRHALILCPRSVLYQWKQELDDCAPELSTYLIRSPQREERRALWNMPMHVYVTTYDMLKGDIENGIMPSSMLGNFDVVVLDEAHHIKNMKSKRFRAIKTLQPTRRWALTGTPIQNKIEDLVSIFEFVYPGYMTSYDNYPERIQEKIKPYFLRRLKKDVLKDLPPKIYDTIELELDEDQDIAYKQAEAGINDEYNELSARGERFTKQHIFARLNQLKQICNFAPHKFISPKTDLLKEQVEGIIDNGNKVIVFSQYVDEGVSKLEKILTPYGVAKIVGGQTDSERNYEIEKFKKNPKIPILIASVLSGGEGLNLTEASYVIHFDHWWNPAVMWQAEDRVHRKGQTKGVNIYSYWMRDTVDDRIRKTLLKKEELIRKIVDGTATESMDELFSEEEWLEILGIKNLEVTKKPHFDSKAWQSMSLSEIREKLFEIKPSEFEGLVGELMHYLVRTDSASLIRVNIESTAIAS